MENTVKPLKTFATRYPFLFALAFFGVSFCLDSGIIVMGRGMTETLYLGIIDIVLQSLLALGVLVGLGWMQSAGFNGPSWWRSLYLLWLPTLLACFYLASAFVTPASGAIVVVYAVVSSLLTGLDEEARFRGVMLQALLPLGPLRGAALSGLFFGLAHLNNLLANAPVLIVLAQTIGAFLLGFGFAACRLRTRTIWPLILFHALYDLPTSIARFNTKNVAAVISTLTIISPLTIAIVVILPGFILACYGLFLLRPRFSQPQIEKQPKTPPQGL